MNICQWKTLAVASMSFVFLLSIVGCNPAIPVPDNTITVYETESGSTFTQAQTVPLTASTPVQIDGTLAGTSDVDVFLLGSFQAGQKISVDLRGRTLLSSTSAAIGLFDEDQDVAYLDQTMISSASGDSFSLIVRKPGEYYLGLCGSGSYSMSVFDYSAVVSVESDQVPTPQKQVVFLNYNGTSGLQIGSDYFSLVLPFSNFGYPISTTAMAAQVTDLVRQDFLGFDIEILSSFETPAPTGPHSTIYVSASEGSFFGLADSVDWYNEDKTDNAVIFAGLFDHSGLTQEQFIIGTANVTSHELGHLVGLAHTDDHTELMDIATPLSQLVKAQDFHRSPLASNEFPIGAQDAIELLQFSLGLLE